MSASDSDEEKSKSFSETPKKPHTCPESTHSMHEKKLGIYDIIEKAPDRWGPLPPKPTLDDIKADPSNLIEELTAGPNCYVDLILQFDLGQLWHPDLAIVKWPWPGWVREAVYLATSLDSFVPYIDMSMPNWQSKPAYLLELSAREKDLVAFFRVWEKNLHDGVQQIVEEEE